MKVLKSHIRLTALVLSFVFSNTALAAESTSNENKNNGTDNTVSNADTTSNASGDAVAPVETQLSKTPANTTSNDQLVEQPEASNNTQSYRQQREERYRQMQEAQLEAYKRHLEQRKQFFANNPAHNNQVPTYIQERRAAYMQEMEERRAFNIKMMEQHRKAADDRRKAMQLKMHQTSTEPEVVEKV
jgi:hypothetical protein